MIVFPNCKINLGLNIVERRPDGFHNLETVFYPVSWRDGLEIIVEENTSTNPFQFSSSGLQISGDDKDNILFKTWQKMKLIRELPPLKVHLHKNIPMGAGLGGGSADAAFFIKQLNTQLSLNMSIGEEMALASEIGSDCAFFILNHPSFASGRGEILEPFELDLSKYYILLINPGVHCNTAEAFAGIVPKPSEKDIRKILQMPLEEWKGRLCNDFEKSIFKKYPQIASLKEELYRQGAIYAAMSGSGSTVFGIFTQVPDLKFAENYSHYLQKPGTKIL